ncbi:hypothetical protein [Halopiger aswanensis]|uniref:hypothetical protein n=1 Tax=Halopiger aswanensis TaxID=148449 RepID=UPI0014739370|nr:hypothetical protein [Halopiger aswanensis]
MSLLGVITLNDRDSDRVVAVCEQCGSAYAAVRSDGTLRPIGVETCSCGSDEFRPLR